MPTRTGPLSPVDVVERVSAVADAGYSGFGIGHADIVGGRDTHGDRGFRQLLDDHGITTLELEYIDDWWTAGRRRADADVVRRDLFDAAAALGAAHVKAGTGQVGDRVEADHLNAEFLTLCEQAAAAGTRIAVEPAAFSMMATITPGVEMVETVGHPAGGLLVDIWHVFRSGQPYEELVELIPPGRLFAVELNDGSRTYPGTLFDDTFDNRLLCGAGDFDVPSFIDVIDRIGFDGLWGVEMMSEYHRTLTSADGARQAADAARTTLNTRLSV
jgi:sugar phosphate isomerase/epimerase